MEWMPLELWRASGLAQETRTVSGMYERALAANDTEAVRALHESIERRIDELENFFVAHSDDERAAFFETQRLKLRSLLQSFHTGARSATRSRGDAGPASPVGSPSTSSPSRAAGGAGSPRRVPDDARLSKEQGEEWFATQGKREMLGVTPAIFGAAFDEVAAGSRDGVSASVRELRRWYFNEFRKGRKSAPRSRKSTREEDAAAAAATAAAPPPIYAWEVEGGRASHSRSRSRSLGGELAGADTMRSSRSLGATTASEALLSRMPAVGMPKPVIEFQVRLTPEEFAALQIRRREFVAERRFKSRVRRATEDREKERTVKVSEEIPKDAILMSGPYVDPAKIEDYIYRTSNPKKWLTASGFVTQ